MLLKCVHTFVKQEITRLVNPLRSELLGFDGAPRRCSSLNGMTIARRRALPRTPITAHLAAANCGFQVER